MAPWLINTSCFSSVCLVDEKLHVIHVSWFLRFYLKHIFGFHQIYIYCLFWKLSTPQTLVLIISFPIKVAIFGIYPVFSHSPFPSSGHRAVSGHHFAAESRRRAGGCCQGHCLVVLHAVPRLGAMGYWGPRSKSRSVASKLPNYSDGPSNSYFSGINWSYMSL